MNKKLYKIDIRLMNNERMEVVVETPSLLALAKDLQQPVLTFLSQSQTDFKSFTLVSANILRMDYHLLEHNPFNLPVIYDLFKKQTV